MRGSDVFWRCEAVGLMKGWMDDRADEEKQQKRHEYEKKTPLTARRDGTEGCFLAQVSSD